jgi:Ion channel
MTGQTHDRRKGTEEGGESFLDDHAYQVLTGAAITLLAIGTIVYHLIEDWGWVDAFYFSAIAVSTVGFGDLVPTTDGGKIFTVFYVFSGIGIITAFINQRLRRHARAVVTRKRA